MKEPFKVRKDRKQETKLFNGKDAARQELVNRVI